MMLGKLAHTLVPLISSHSTKKSRLFHHLFRRIEYISPGTQDPDRLRVTAHVAVGVKHKLSLSIRLGDGSVAYDAS